MRHPFPPDTTLLGKLSGRSTVRRSVPRAWPCAVVVLLGAPPLCAQITTTFPDEYIQQYDNTREYVVPEAFELATILLTLTEWGRGPGRRNFFTDTPYADSVQRHFAPFLDHPLLRALDEIDFSSFTHVVGFRENSFAYHFESDRLVKRGFLDSWWTPQSLPDHFGAHRELIEDFVRVSGYRGFYLRHATLYQDEAHEFDRMVNLGRAIRWLDGEFPVRYNMVRVLFSPLIRGNHSSSIKRSDRFAMLSVVVAGPRMARVPSVVGGDLVMLRQLFTEIDHGYVDPVSVTYMDAIRSAFSRPDKWYGDPTGFYAAPFASFNEYMTWGAMLLFVRETVEGARFQLAREEVTDYMVRSRRFIAFEAFFDALQALYDSRAAGTTLADLYPDILAWARIHQG